MEKLLTIVCLVVLVGVAVAKVVTLDVPEESVGKVADSLEAAGLKDQADTVRKQSEPPPAPKELSVKASKKNKDDQSTLAFAGDVTAELQGGSVTIDGKTFTVISADYDAGKDETIAILPKGQATPAVKNGKIEVPQKDRVVEAKAQIRPSPELFRAVTVTGDPFAGSYQDIGPVRSKPGKKNHVNTAPMLIPVIALLLIVQHRRLRKRRFSK